MTSADSIFSELSRRLRRIGQEELLPRFENGVDAGYKPDGSLITAADHAVDARVQETLAELGTREPVLSEEQSPKQQRHILETAPAFWLLDPLDGTGNFAGGMPFFAISVARVEGHRVTHGATYDPVRDELFHATAEGDLLLNQAPPPTIHRPAPDTLRHAIALIDFKRLTPALARRIVTHTPYRSQRNLGACALEWAWIAVGRADLYLHGGQALWDSAAGSLLLARGGGALEGLDTDPVFQRSLDKRSAVAARSPALLARWREWLTARPGNLASTS